MFDSRGQYTFNLPSATDPKKIVTQYPTDQQWIDRSRRRKLIEKSLGRGQSETIVTGGPEADADLMAAIMVESRDVLPAEAARIIERLGKAEIEEVEKTEEGYQVTMRVLTGTVSHTLRMPNAQQIDDYRKPVGGLLRFITLANGRTEIRTNIEVPARLYDGTVQSTNGYAEGSAVPIVHKMAAFQAVVNEYERQFEGEGPDDF